jgi:DNA-binding XRE family transcriptional regulator
VNFDTGFFAQAASTAVASKVAGWDVVISLGVLTALALNITSLARGGRQKREVEPGEKAIEVRPAPEYVTAHACATSHHDLIRRMEQQEKGVSELWATMRKEDEETRRELARYAQVTERAVGRIEGKLDQLMTTLHKHASSLET